MQHASVSFASDEDCMRMPAPLYLPPQQFDNSYAYGAAADNSSGDEPLVLTENYRPISPPAEYAEYTPDSSADNRASRYFELFP